MSQDIAKEPVDLTDDAEFMDTGVLHEGRVCTKCADHAAARGQHLCKDCLEKEKS